MSRNRTFQQVGKLSPSRSVFDLSYTKVFDCDMGQLIPVMCDEVVPGDHFTINNEMVVRMQPMLAPILHEIYITTHYFFCPYRRLGELVGFDFEEFITGGELGDFTGSPPTMFGTTYDNAITGEEYTNTFNFPKGTLPDFLGYPIGDIPMTALNAPVKWPMIAYNWVYNEFYRDENLAEEVSMDQLHPLYTAWTKDYFTSSLPFVQRGTVPALPIDVSLSGSPSLTLNPIDSSVIASSLKLTSTGHEVIFQTPNNSDAPLTNFYARGGRTSDNSGPFNALFTINNSGQSMADPAGTATGSMTLGANGIDFVSLKVNDNGNDIQGTGSVGIGSLSVDASSFNINDLRLAFQISKWQERNARAGVRYTEFLYAHFGVSPRDERLQRPEYIGGTRNPIIVSEVLQTSSTDATTPQGNMAGHGISVASTHVGSYTVREFGLILGVLKITPRPSYMPQGVNRQWRRMTRFDHYFREFANLGEQGILNSEIFVDGTDGDDDIFGFQGRFDEMRVKQNMVCNNMRDTFSYWHLARQFASRPSLNHTFVTCNPDKRIFAVQDEPGFIVHYANRIKAVRPMPVLSEPGLVDHF